MSQVTHTGVTVTADDLRKMWQPIETAPKDGTHVLLLVDSRKWPVVAFWFYGDWTSREPWTGTPTHWMPLPAAPEPSP